jgi:histone H3/H4
MAAGELSIAAVHRLIEKAGAERVGDDAAEELRRILEDLAERVGKKAKELAAHAGRKTVKADDIRLAVRELIRE